MPQWNPAPDQFTLDANCVDVWLIQIDDEAPLPSLLDLLPPAERERAARFKFDKDRRLFATAHASMRAILAKYLDGNPIELEFIEGQNGKPKFSPDFARRKVEFNLSHSHQAALLAVALGRVVGVDIEYIKRDFEFVEVAERFFTMREVAALRSLPSDLRRQAFFKCWTAKEAFLKAKGTGLSGALDEVEIALNSEGQVKISAAVPGWILTELDSVDGYEAALVYQESAASIHSYRWSF
ncbi:MAG TPA: 4'-phosphopantetheinyl transferase superfamily protein [Candidatus Binatus sp.]|nr:4'-phosphopantetheinyl transferase superfamily protein [Candidatus Binatus sp.]